MKIKEKILNLVKQHSKNFYIAFIVCLIGIPSLVCPLIANKFPSVLDILFFDFPYIEDLMLSLFSTQASITSIVIAIIALLTATRDNTVFGIRVSTFVMEYKPTILKYKYIVITNFILVVISYIAISKEWYTLVVSTFFVNIFLVSILAKRSFNTFIQTSDEQLIYAYHLNNISQKTIEWLRDDFEVALYKHDKITLEKDRDLLKKLLETLLNTEKNDAERKLIKSIEDVYIFIFKQVYEMGWKQQYFEFINFVVDAYKNANENQYPLTMYDNIDKELFNMISEVPLAKIHNSYILEILHDELYKNMVVEENEKGQYSINNNYGMEDYTSDCYYQIFINGNAIDDKHGFYIKKGMYETIENHLKDEKNDDLNAIKKDILKKELILYTLRLIDNFEEELIDECIFKNLESTWDILKLQNSEFSEFWEEYFIIIFSYLYYIEIEAEKNVSNKLKKFVSKICDTYKEFYDELFMDVDFTKYDYKSIILIYSKIYRFERKNQDMVLENTLEKFMIFTILCFSKTDEIKLYENLKNKVTKNKHTFSDEFLVMDKKVAVEEYKRFCDLFSDMNTGTDYEFAVCQFQDVISKIIKENIIQEANEKL